MSVRGSMNRIHFIHVVVVVFFLLKDIVCTLHEGDEFGKLALLNNAPRTTSVQLREAHCCFLKVDRDDYKR